MRIASALILVTVLSAAGAGAQPGPPNPGGSIVPAFIDLVGSSEGTPDPAGQFTVTVRDASANPVPDALVTIDFSACPDLRPAAVQPYPGLMVSCDMNQVSAITDASGEATFIILGSVVQRSPSSGAGCAAVRATADATTVLLGSTSVAVYDQDGIDGVTTRDLELWQCDFFDGAYQARSDYSHSGTETNADLAILASRMSQGNSSQTGTRCDGQPVVSPTVVAQEGGLNAAWDECIGGGGTLLQTFDCSSVGSTSRSAFFSVVAPPGLGSVRGFEAVVIVGGNHGAPLPDYWRLDNAGCASGVAPDTPSSSCSDLSFILAMDMTYPYLAPHQGRMVVRGYDSPQALSAGQEYSLFSLTRSRSGPVPEPCSGCEQPVELRLESVTLFQGPVGQGPGGCTQPGDPPAPHVLVNQTATSNTVYWQALLTGIEPDAGAARLALARSGANPTSGDVAVRLTLPRAAPATVGLYDLSGRLLRSRAVGQLGPGTHHIMLARAGELRAALYFVRLSQGGESRYLKVSVLD